MSTEKTDLENTYVWWVNHSCQDAITSLPDTFPTYLREQWKSRLGRPGRCRLWTDDDIFESFSINPWPDNALTRWLMADDYGGITVRYEDLKVIDSLPGVVTDRHMKRVTR